VARPSSIGFLAGLLAIDTVIVLGLGFLPGRVVTAPAPVVALPAPAVGATAATADAGPPPPLWNGVDPRELAQRVADLYLGVRRRLGKGQKKVLLAPPRRVGDDVELRVSLARATAFPAGQYCFHCASSRCLFPAPTLAALEALVAAFDGEAVKALAAKVGKEHLELTFVGGASAGPVVPRADAQVCDGPEPRLSVRVPPAYDEYAPDQCGSRRCELAGSGERFDVGAGPIDDNKKLACLRAVCAGAAATGLADVDVPVRYVGDLAFDAGEAFRGAEVVLTLRGIASAPHREAYQAFWTALTAALGDEK
jgi:hypothetical protein